MPFVQAKCPECGGILAVDNDQKAAICQFCGKPYIVEEAVNNYITYNVTNNTTNNVTNQNFGDGAVINIVENSGSVSALTERVFMFLEEGNFSSADDYCEKILDIDPECAQAYLGKLMADLKVEKKACLMNCKDSFDKNPNYEKIVRLGSDELKIELQGYVEAIKLRNTENAYQVTVSAMEKAVTLQEFEDVVKNFEMLKNYKDSEKLCETANDKREMLKRALVEKKKKLEGVDRWISTGNGHTVGLKSNGTVVATKYLVKYSQYRYQCNVEDWTDIVAISAGFAYTVGLKSDGTVVATGDNTYGQCNVFNWENIVAISAGSSHTVGLKSDGTVVATKYSGKCGDDCGQCEVDALTDIVAISAGSFHTVGLKFDGTVVATEYKGYKYRNQCEVSSWENIVAISAGSFHTVGLKSDGTAVSTSYILDRGQSAVSDWTDLVAISASDWHTVGLKSDGTVVATGDNTYGQCNVFNWKNIVAISAGGSQTVGLKSDGTVVAVGKNENGQCNVNDWKLFDDFENLEEEQKIKIAEKKQEQIEQERIAEQKRIEEEKKRIEQERIETQKKQYREQGLCQHCGREFKGLFGKKCVKCGKPKDY